MRPDIRNTHFQRYGSPKDAQAQLRHSKLEMIESWYMKEIPETRCAPRLRRWTPICVGKKKPPFYSTEPPANALRLDGFRSAIGLPSPRTISNTTRALPQAAHHRLGISVRGLSVDVTFGRVHSDIDASDHYSDLVRTRACGAARELK